MRADRGAGAVRALVAIYLVWLARLIYLLPRKANTESRGGQEGNGCWVTGAVLVVFVVFSDGSSAGI